MSRTKHRQRMSAQQWNPPPLRANTPSPFDAEKNVLSATECTGLMPTPPQNDAEFMSYQDLHSMEIPKKLPGKRNFELGVYDDKPEDIQL